MVAKIWKTYWLVWKTSALLSIQTAFENRFAAALFVVSKFMRFVFFTIFLLTITQHQTSVGGYTGEQLFLFFLVFNLFDLFGQILFRGIYWFRQQIISGEFDFRLVKPLNELFLALTRQIDILDVPLLIIVIILLIKQPISLLPIEWFIAMLFFIAALITIVAFHILVACIGVITTEVDNVIMIYRDASSMARFPVDIYSEIIRGLLTFVLPIGLAFSFPAKALMGLMALHHAVIALVAAMLVLFISLRLWDYSLKQYSSASS